ncbi:MAG TPA: class I SAM-dependent methyltransferase [Blastocatellia bacterium]
MTVDEVMPGLAEALPEILSLSRAIRPQYEWYVREVSPSYMAISLKAAAVLQVLCERLKPIRILELGSGFSSFVLRRYAALANATVCSIDDSSQWLDQTRAFLEREGLSTDEMILWGDFKEREAARFDFIFHDLGDMSLRQTAFHDVLTMAAGGGVVFLDDMHKPPYAQHVRAALRNFSCSYVDLKRYTFDEFGRYCGLALFAREADTM